VPDDEQQAPLPGTALLDAAASALVSMTATPPRPSLDRMEAAGAFACRGGGNGIATQGDRDL
jgi:hypothetical protein